MTDPYNDDLFRMRTEMRFSMSMSTGRRAFVKLPTEGLPEPLRRVAEQMDSARTDDEARAAAHEFLLLSKEWTQ